MIIYNMFPVEAKYDASGPLVGILILTIPTVCILPHIFTKLKIRLLTDIFMESCMALSEKVCTIRLFIGSILFTSLSLQL